MTTGGTGQTREDPVRTVSNPHRLRGGRAVDPDRSLSTVAGQITSLDHVDLDAKTGDLKILPGYDHTSTY
jgi:hypothetical protein